MADEIESNLYILRRKSTGKVLGACIHMLVKFRIAMLDSEDADPEDFEWSAETWRRIPYNCELRTKSVLGREEIKLDG